MYIDEIDKITKRVRTPLYGLIVWSEGVKGNGDGGESSFDKDELSERQGVEARCKIMATKQSPHLSEG